VSRAEGCVTGIPILDSEAVRNRLHVTLVLETLSVDLSNCVVNGFQVLLGEDRIEVGVPEALGLVEDH